MTRSALSVFIVLLLPATAALAADSLPQLATRVYTSNNKLILEVSGTAPDASDWLGLSFYKPDCKDSTWDADHSVQAVKGEFRVSLPVPEGFSSGTYEIGLWKSRLGENTFYRAERLRGYGAGSVATGPTEVKLADSLSAMKTEIAATDGGKVLKISGEAADNCWLGVSFYKPEYADAVLDGNYSMLDITKGSYSQSLAVPPDFEAGTYEVALWGKMLARKKVFRMGTELAYGAGKVGK